MKKVDKIDKDNKIEKSTNSVKTKNSINQLQGIDKSTLDMFSDIEVDEKRVELSKSSKERKRSKSKEKAKEKAKAMTLKNIPSLSEQIEKVNNAIERYSKSQNIKNTDYLYNNLIKLSKKALETAEKLNK